MKSAIIIYFENILQYNKKYIENIVESNRIYEETKKDI